MMIVSIGCKELGFDCDFVREGDTADAVVESFMEHVQSEHVDGWFELEEAYQAAWSVVRRKAA